MMHIEGPWLSTTGKKKGRQKFRNAAQAQQARQQAQEWAELKKKWAAESTPVATPVKPLKFSVQPPRAGTNNRNIPSRDSGVGNAPAAEVLVYTGDKMLGVAQMAKSNAIPVFDTGHIVEIARMRR